MKLIYKDEWVRLIQGDCLEVMDQMIEKEIKVDAIITDPPYGTTACKWDSVIPFDDMWSRLNTLTKENGVMIFTASQPYTSELIHSNLKLFKYELIWIKSKASDFINANYRPMKKHENIVVFSKGNASPGCKNQMTYNPQGIIYEEKKRVRKGTLGIARDRDSQQGEYISKGTNYPTSLLQIANEGKTQHPTQKPVALMEYLINTYTNEGEIVLDFTCGSGTTLVASRNLKRKAYGIEIDEKYCEIAKQRLENTNIIS